MNTRKIGDFYEREVVRYLQKNGYQILERNYRCKFGEIDVIAKAPDQRTIIYGETKFRRSSGSGSGLEAVNFKKQRRICKTAMFHYAKYGMAAGLPVRFDVFEVDANGQITHVENAFDYME